MGIGLRHDTRDIVVGDEVDIPADLAEAWRALEIRLAPRAASETTPTTPRRSDVTGSTRTW